MSNTFALMLNQLVTRYAKKRNWAGYTWIDDWKCDALVTLCQNWHKFDETRVDRHGRTNPFAYYTQIIHYSFLNSLESETKLRDIRDEISISYGLMPSWAGQDLRRANDQKGEQSGDE